MAIKVLITGATGFIGSFIVEEALRRGFEVWAAIRRTSNLEYVRKPGVNLIELDLGNKKQMAAKLKGMGIDYVVHAAGVTKSTDVEAFRKVNTLGTKNLVEALISSKIPLKRFIYLSSLSIFGPVREEPPYEEIKDSDTPCPNTAYGRSKLEAEHYLEGLQGFPYIILRPTGVYGPREKDYFLMAKSVKAHVDFAAGFKEQVITFVYVEDVVQAVFLAFDKGRLGGKYFLSDGCLYKSSTFSDLIRRELGNPWIIRIKAPLWILRIITLFGEYIGRLTGNISALNNDKYNILKQRNWRCDISPAEDELGYNPRFNLDMGVRATIKWYKDNGWL